MGNSYNPQSSPQVSGNPPTKGDFRHDPKQNHTQNGIPRGRRYRHGGGAHCCPGRATRLGAARVLAKCVGHINEDYIVLVETETNDGGGSRLALYRGDP